MAIKFFQEVRIVWHNVPCIEDSLFHGPERRCIPTPVLRVAVNADIRLGAELLGITFRAQTVLHARTLRVQRATRPVGHVAVDECVEFWLQVGVRDFCRNQLVHFGGSARLVIVSKDE